MVVMLLLVFRRHTGQEETMRKTQFTVLTLALFATGIICDHLKAQSAKEAQHAVGIVLSIAVPKNKLPAGQSPVIIFGVENVSPSDFVIHDYMYRLHVDGEHGEPPTTYRQRLITHKLRAGEAEMGSDEWVEWRIFPGMSDDRRLQVSGYYDVSAPGKYSAYVEVEDPTSGKWLRTRTVKFEIVTEIQ
jgi:hypothetical protein